MNIEHEGKTYEVLTIDELNGHIPFRLYVRLASGQINEADYVPSSELVGVKVRCDQYEVGKYSLEAFGIQPLRLVPKEPVTFEATFARESTGYWYPLHHLDDGIAYGGKVQRRFRCVEIVEAEHDPD